MTSTFNKQDLYNVDGLVAVVTGGLVLQLVQKIVDQLLTFQGRRLRIGFDHRPYTREQRSQGLYHWPQREKIERSGQTRRTPNLNLKNTRIQKAHS